MHRIAPSHGADHALAKRPEVHIPSQQGDPMSLDVPTVEGPCGSTRRAARQPEELVLPAADTRSTDAAGKTRYRPPAPLADDRHT